MVLFFSCTCAPQHGDNSLQQAHEAPLPICEVEPPSVFRQQDHHTPGPVDKAQEHGTTAGSAVDNVASSTTIDNSSMEQANPEDQPSLPRESVGRSSVQNLNLTTTVVPASAHHTDRPTSASSPSRQSTNVSLVVGFCFCTQSSCCHVDEIPCPKNCSCCRLDHRL